MPDKQQMQKWKDKIEWYKDTILGLYGKQPSEKLIASFCKINKIPWPLPDIIVIDDPEMDFLN